MIIVPIWKVVINNLYPPLNRKDAVNKKNCNNNLLSSNNKTDIFSKKYNWVKKTWIWRSYNGSIKCKHYSTTIIHNQRRCSMDWWSDSWTSFS